MLLLLVCSASAQEIIRTPIPNTSLQTTILDPGPEKSDFPWPKDDAHTRKKYTYTPIREADAMWAKRVWRVIDLREKMNQPLYFPLVPTNDRMSLFDVIKKGVKDGKLTIYDNAFLDDEFKVPLYKEEAWSKFMRIDTLQYEQLDGTWATRIDTIYLMSENIKQYWIKEDWFFDKQRGVMDVRIIGICPLKENIDPSTLQVRGYQPLFWIYFPELRGMLANHETLVRQNNADRMSYDEIFSTRFFSSMIRKESNVYERSIAEYKTGLDAVLEAENIKDNIFTMEHDMWHF